MLFPANCQLASSKANSTSNSLCQDHEHTCESVGHCDVDSRCKSELIVQSDQFDSLFLGGIEFEAQPAPQLSSPMNCSRREISCVNSDIEMLEELVEDTLALNVIFDLVRQIAEVRIGPRSTPGQLFMILIFVLGLATGRSGTRKVISVLSF